MLVTAKGEGKRRHTVTTNTNKGGQIDGQTDQLTEQSPDKVLREKHAGRG